MNFLSQIEAKRDGKTLSGEQIQGIIAADAADIIPNYQMAAFLMTIFFARLDARS